jgi:hypothetical protein
VLLVFDVVAGVWCYWCLYSFCSVLSVVVVNVSFGIGVTYFVAYCLKNNCSAFFVSGFWCLAFLVLGIIGVWCFRCLMILVSCVCF